MFILESLETKVWFPHPPSLSIGIGMVGGIGRGGLIYGVGEGSIP